MIKRNEVILQVKGLGVELGGEKIIEGVSFEVKRGEVMVVLGPNGAGKTTLLRALLGIIPYQGEVKWGTKKISYLPPSELLQRRGVLPMRVRDFYSLKGVTGEVVEESLQEVGLKREVVEASLASLSRGELQRVAIAWALVNKPEVLLLDEPMSGVDMEGKETVYSLLDRQNRSNQLTIVLVSHDLSVVWGRADKVLCLGRKDVCYGAPREVLTTENLQELYNIKIKYHIHGRR